MGWFTGRRAGARWSGCSTASPAAPACAFAEPPVDGGDSPAWSRKRGAYQPPEDAAGVASRLPYAELHAHSAYSFLDGASTPEELVEEAVRLDLRAIALTDHDGLYGVVRFAEAAKELNMRTVFGAELSLGNDARTEDPDPPGPAPAGARPRAGGLPAAVASAGQRTPGRRREGQAALRLRRAHRGRGRALAHPDRLPQRPCAPSAYRRRARRGRDSAGRPGGPVRRRPGQHRADPPRPSARRRTQRRAGRAGAEVRRRRRRHHRRALRRAVTSPAGHGDGRHPGPATRWTRPPDTLPRWVVRTCVRERRWRGCSRTAPRW